MDVSCVHQLFCIPCMCLVCISCFVYHACVLCAPVWTCILLVLFVQSLSFNQHVFLFVSCVCFLCSLFFFFFILFWFFIDRQLSGVTVNSEEEAFAAIEKLHQTGTKTVVLSSSTLGSKGVLLCLASTAVSELYQLDLGVCQLGGGGGEVSRLLHFGSRGISYVNCVSVVWRDGVGWEVTPAVAPGIQAHFCLNCQCVCVCVCVGGWGEGGEITARFVASGVQRCTPVPGQRCSW